MSRFVNPYNFVRPLPAPKLKPLSEATADQHLLWRCPPPPHDRYTGLSGRITCTMTAATPVFVSGDAEDPKAEHQTYRLFEVNGQYLIPGASLRGPIRSVFEAATNSAFGAFSFTDEHLFYRLPADSALGLVPARVEADESSESGFGLRFLTGSAELQPTRRSKTLYAAWIPRHPNPQILQKKDQRKHRHLLRQNQLVVIPKDCEDGQSCYAAIFNTRTLSPNDQQGFPHWQADFIHRDPKQVDAWIKAHRNHDYQQVQGYAYSTGLNADVKQYERFFYEDGRHPTITTPLEEDVWKAYDALMKDYYDRRVKIAESLKSQSKQGRSGIVPSRFVSSPEHLRVGTLVYADIGEKDASGHYPVRAIYPVNISRARYRRTVRDVIQSRYPHLLPPTKIEQLCLASRVFGWVSQDSEKRPRTEQVAYRGRVRFSDALPQALKLGTQSKTLAILGEPHPTSVEFYLEDNGAEVVPRKSQPHGYDDDRASIRGRKFQRHHGKWNWDIATTHDQSDQNRTIQNYYDEGTTWTFHIDFDSLQPVELGALLWTLELNFGDQRGFHRIGYGKPLGLGSVTIDVDDISIYDAAVRYAGDGSQDGRDTTIDKDACVRAFTTTMAALYGRPFDELAPIRDLKALLTPRRDELPIHYPRLDPGPPGEDNPGFAWFMDNRKSTRPERLSPADQDKGLPYEVGRRR
ncbi:MAG: TIGR03986 family CRISPR-associated RAMP protein [Anaerolineae bacterium]|nr:TIGR03986 family CRISPR-associated RAMP protein [Anaerolineae bacterium]